MVVKKWCKTRLTNDLSKMKPGLNTRMSALEDSSYKICISGHKVFQTVNQLKMIGFLVNNYKILRMK